jgi:hypothetical protein
MSVHSRSDGKVGSDNTDIFFLLRIDLFALFQLIIFFYLSPNLPLMQVV